MALGAVSGLVEADVIDPVVTAEWRASLDEQHALAARVGDLSDGDGDGKRLSRERASDALATYEVTLLTLRAGEAGAGDMHLAVATGVADALARIGLIDEGEAAGWRQRFERALGRRPPAPPASESAALAVPARSLRSARGRPDPAPATVAHPTADRSFPTEAALAALQAVLAVDGSASSPITFRALEQYVDGFALLWLTPATPSHRSASHLLTDAVDDLGTRYLTFGGGIRTCGPTLRHERLFTPAIAEGAGSLTVTIGQESFVLALGQPG